MITDPTMCHGDVVYVKIQANARRIQNETFYQQTVQAMDAKAAQKLSGMGGGDDDEAVFQKLRTTKLAPEDKQAIAVQRQRYESPLKMPHPSGDDDSHDGQDGEKSIAGRKKIPAGQSQVSLEDREDPEVEAELNAILKRSPSMSCYFISTPALFILTDSVFSSFFPSFSREMQLLIITPLTNTSPPPFGTFL